MDFTDKTPAQLREEAAERQKRLGLTPQIQNRIRSKMIRSDRLVAPQDLPSAHKPKCAPEMTWAGEKLLTFPTTFKPANNKKRKEKESAE